MDSVRLYRETQSKLSYIGQRLGVRGSMEGGSGHYNPRTVEEVFKDFRGRRAGMIKALTTGASLSLSLSLPHLPISAFMVANTLDLFLADVEKFYQQCDPGELYFYFDFVFLISFLRILKTVVWLLAFRLPPCL